MEKTVEKNMFESFSVDVYKKLGIEEMVETQYIRKYIDELIFQFLGKTLIFLVNEKRIKSELVGDTPYERFKDFEKHYLSSGKTWKEICCRFPDLVKDLKNAINTYLSFISSLEEMFMQDKNSLVSGGLISPEAKWDIINIQPLGDFHNGKAVTLIEAGSFSIIFKPKSIENEIFYNNFLSFLNGLFIDKKINLATIPYVNRLDYGWVEYLTSSPIEKKADAKKYYEKVGVLLAIAYFLNISDLHFENILSFGDNPLIVDVETIFTLATQKTIYPSNAYKKISNYLEDSILATGMLPMSFSNRIFGGDVSGILGGKFIKERSVLENNFRDDVKLVRKSERIEYKRHLPYYLKNNEKIYLNPVEYSDVLVKGFEYTYQKFLEYKEEILNFLDANSYNLVTRLLARNTMEYGLIIDLAKSPAYYEKRDNLYEKLRKFAHFNNDYLIDSEIKQLKSQSIPYFYTLARSKVMKDIYKNEIMILPETPYDKCMKKIKKMSLEDMKFQSKIIEFSLISDQTLYVDGEYYTEYSSSNLKKYSVLSGIDDLFKIIHSNLVFGEDHSMNLLSLTVGNYEELELAPLDSSLYNGLTGLGFCMLNFYQENPFDKVFQIMSSLYKTLSAKLISDENFSFFNGKFGRLLFLFYYEIRVLGKTPDYSKIDSFMIQMKKEYFNSTNQQYDIINGYSGIAISIFNDELLRKRYKSVIIEIGEIIYNNTKLTENFAFWESSKVGQIMNPSYAHGNSGIMTMLIISYCLTKKERYKTMFLKAWQYDKSQMLKSGWIDNRFQGRKTSTNSSANWCHGSTGLAVARLQWLEFDKIYHIFSNNVREEIMSELNHAIKNIKQEGLTINNFCLCHGITGNLLILDYYQKKYAKEDLELEHMINMNFRSMVDFGIEKSWLCGLGTSFHSYGLMTGISGILYGLLKYQFQDNNLGVLALKL